MDDCETQMTRETCGVSPDRATRALILHLNDLNTQLKLLPLNSRLRGPLITRIRDVEDRIGWVEGL
jgi:hypothetical protein